jgi:hypothetical protein
MADFGLRISDWVAWPTRVIARSAATWQSLADLGLQAVPKAQPSAPPGQSLPPVIPRHPRVGGEKAGSRRGRGRGWSILGFGNAEWECHHLPFRVIARSLIDLMRSIRRSNLDAGTTATLLPSGKGEIMTPRSSGQALAGRSHKIDQWLPRDDTMGKLLSSSQAPGTTPPEVPSPRGVARTAQPGGTGGGAPVDRNAGAGAGAATHPVSPMPPGACPSGSHPSQEGIFAWAMLLRRSCPVARARSRPLVPRGRL